jgi:hypothetical protein
MVVVCEGAVALSQAAMAVIPTLLVFLGLVSIAYSTSLTTLVSPNE